MSDQNKIKPNASEAFSDIDPEHRRDEITREIRVALMRLQSVTMLMLKVDVNANGVTLTGEVYTRREYELIGKVAQQHSHGLVISNLVHIFTENTARSRI